MKYYSAIKKKQILPFEITRIDLEGFMLSEISQRKTISVLAHLVVESGKKQWRIPWGCKEFDMTERL